MRLTAAYNYCALRDWFSLLWPRDSRNASPLDLPQCQIAAVATDMTVWNDRGRTVGFVPLHRWPGRKRGSRAGGGSWLRSFRDR